MPGSISEAPTSRRPGSPFLTYRINGRFLPAHDLVTGTPELLCGTNRYWLNFETYMYSRSFSMQGVGDVRGNGAVKTLTTCTNKCTDQTIRIKVGERRRRENGRDSSSLHTCTFSHVGKKYM